MADNTGEEHLDNPINNQSENPPDKVAFNANTENINLNQETENMEVHHHGHHGHEKKTWKSYFWEFFMLFLAVFFGSLAELQIEHYIENKREKQYIEALIMDLKADTASIRSTIKSNERRELFLDSILFVTNLDLTINGNAKELVRLFMRSAYRPAHAPSSIAIDQLKNTGSFRLFNHKMGVADSILRYEKSNERIIIHNDLYQHDLNEVWEAFYPICDVKIFRDSSYATFTSTKRSLTDKPVPPLHLSQEKLSVFTGHITRQVLINAVNRLMLENQNQKAISLITFLEKEYRLK
jgi:hypothetical protein